MAPQTSVRTSKPTRVPPATALTTVFTQPPACSNLTNRFQTSVCMPPKWSSYRSDKAGYYSPGVCPESYHSDCSRPTGEAFGPSLIAGETAVICCPNSYSCAPDNASYCLKDDRFAYAIQVRYRSQDLPVLARATSSFSASLAASTSSIAGAVHTAATQKNTGGLSTGAKAAIGVTVPIIVLGVVIGVVLFLWRKSQRKSRAASAVDDAKHTGTAAQMIFKPFQSASKISIPKSGGDDRSSIRVSQLIGPVRPAARHQPEYVAGRPVLDASEPHSPTISPVSVERPEGASWGIGRTPGRDMPPVQTVPRLVRTHTEQTDLAVPVDRSIQVTPAQAYVRPVPPRLSQQLPPTPEATEEPRDGPFAARSAQSVHRTGQVSNAFSGRTNTATTPKYSTPVSAIESGNPRHATPTSPRLSQHVSSQHKYSTSITLNEARPSPPPPQSATIITSPSIPSSPISSPLSSSSTIAVTPMANALSPHPPRLSRHASEMAPIPVAPQECAQSAVAAAATAVKDTRLAPMYVDEREHPAYKSDLAKSGAGDGRLSVVTATPVVADTPVMAKLGTAEALRDVLAGGFGRQEMRSPDSGFGTDTIGGVGGGYAMQGATVAGVGTEMVQGYGVVGEAAEKDLEVRRLRSEQRRVRKRRATLEEMVALEEEDMRLQRSLEERLRRLSVESMGG